MRFVGALFALLVLGLAGVVLDAGGHGAAVAPATFQDTSLRPCNQEFAQFYAGPAFQGLPMTDHSRICTAPDPTPSVAAGGKIDPDSRGRSNFDSYVYGSCKAEPDQGCAPPLEIQTWPACERSAADYRAGPAGAAHPIEPVEMLNLRGVPARLYDDNSLELSTDDVTVVIYGHGRDDLLEAAEAVRTEAGAPFTARAGATLPPPVAGAQDGTLAC